MSIILMTIYIVLLISLIALLILIPNKKSNSKIMISSSAEIDERVKKMMKIFGADILSATPKSMLSKQLYGKKIDKLFKESNNPWHVTKEEFYLLKVCYGIAGFLLALMIFGIMKFLEFETLIASCFFIIPIFAYMYPTLKYKSDAEYRIRRFKIELPEAVDYLTMALFGGGYVLSSAFEEVIDYLQDGIIKDEFKIIVNDLRAGKTIESALTDFADRAPVDSIKSFTMALINANRLSVSMTEILRIRAKESRRDLEAEIEQRLIKLPSKITMILTPTSCVALVLVSITPAVFALMQML